MASVFSNVWNFPVCIGAMEAKRFFPRANSGSEYNSIIMLALVDANYKFMCVDVGIQNQVSNACIWEKCNLKRYLEEQRLQVPRDSLLPSSNTQSPYVIVGSDAFPLRSYLMTPYPGQQITPQQRIFNYRLSRARLVSENAVGILAAKFRIFQSPINSKSSHVKKIIFTSVALHNFLMENCKTYITSELLRREDIDQGSMIPGVWKEAPSGFEDLQGMAQDHSNDAKRVRDNLKDYFMSSGQVPWQEKMALHH